MIALRIIGSVASVFVIPACRRSMTAASIRSVSSESNAVVVILSASFAAASVAVSVVASIAFLLLG